MVAELQLSLLGQLQISQDGKPVAGFVSAKGQALLCYLAVTGLPHTREHLAGLLWGERSDQEAKSNLRQALTNLRKLFGPYLIITRDTVEFNRASPYWLDVELFEALMAASAPKRVCSCPARPSSCTGVISWPVFLSGMRRILKRGSQASASACGNSPCRVSTACRSSIPSGASTPPPLTTPPGCWP
jgi:hypothetical protein